jgi:hypothetical protein
VPVIFLLWPAFLVGLRRAELSRAEGGHSDEYPASGGS